MLFVLKLVLVPALVLSVSLAGRRWGPRVAGVLTSFPIVSGPALFFLAVEQGDVFAAEASRATLAALVAVAASGLAYAWASLRTPWWLSLLACWLAFVAASFLLLAWRWTAVAALVAALASFALARALLPASVASDGPPARTAWDLPLRMLSAMTLVLVVTELAQRLGPNLSGAFTPFPVALSILLAFSHVQQGPATAIHFLRGFFPGMSSMSVFCFVVALAVAPLGHWAGFLLAVAVAIPVQALVLWWMELRQGVRADVPDRATSPRPRSRAR